MISVDEALAHLFALVSPLPDEPVPLRRAAGRVLARPLAAGRDQPPFDASAMDGYALRAEDARPGARLEVIGQAAAGARFEGNVAPGQAVRIFTGAPLPPGADLVVIQENARTDGNSVVLGTETGSGTNIRPAGADFRAGFTLAPPRRLGPTDIALIAAMNHAEVPAVRRPVVAVLATGDELVMPGEVPGPDQIVASGSFGVAAMLEQAGAEVRLLPIARDRLESLVQALRMGADADLVVTIGGASVGDHDLVGPAAEALGMARAFYKVAIRPGKPLMAGRLGRAAMVGLPGNPVSAMVCTRVFLLPLLAAMEGFPPAPARRLHAPLAAPLEPNGPREHYMRGLLTPDGLAAAPTQDSGAQRTLAEADVLIVRPPRDGARAAGETVPYLPLSPASTAHA